MGYQNYKMPASTCLTVLFAACLLLMSAAQAARFVAGDTGKLKTVLRKENDDSDLTPDAKEDLILALPGFQNTLPSNHFGGYITVDEDHGRNLYYYFVESQRDPTNDPVVLWLNGGPGCSSFDGFVYEHGPFLYSLQGKPGSRGVEVALTANPFGWDQVANMIFLDSPAGVGMSYSRTASDYEVEDFRTAADADRFLRGWFRRFPQFANNPFFVTGESYAGIYVPNLVRQVLEGNEAGLEPKINIVGYMVGNGCTDKVYDGNAYPLYAATKSLLPWRGFQQLEQECSGSYWNITPGSTCDKMWRELSTNLAFLNMYDTLQYCFHDGPAADAADLRAARRNARVGAAAVLNPHTSTPAATSASAIDQATPRVAAASSRVAAASSRVAAASSRVAAAALTAQLAAAGLVGVWPLPGGAVRPGPVLNWAHVNRKLGRLGVTPPCTDSRAADLWLNDPAVRDAIHAAPTAAIGPWTLCSDKISYTRTHGSMIPVHVNNTKGHGLRALIYSGDHDFAVPHTGSEAWTGDLGFRVKQPWQPWFVADDQVAGYVVEYDHGLSYATVKGAGHMVPETNPREALAMFQRFIDGQSLA